LFFQSKKAFRVKKFRANDCIHTNSFYRLLASTFHAEKSLFLFDAFPWGRPDSQSRSLMRAFLTADWRHLLMLNYAVEPDLLRTHVPSGVELDSWNGNTFLSVVGFLFQRTTVLGWRVPFHTNFEEVNLRFYVRRRAPEGWRRGVVFIKEIVPRRLIAGVARVCYNEPYSAMPMRHRVETTGGALRSGSLVEYSWRYRGQWQTLRATAIGAPRAPLHNSEEEFITEHYWGYTAQQNGGCAEYQVEHPRWNVWQAEAAELRCDAAALYGKKFAVPLGSPPESAFIADGSPVTVTTGAPLKAFTTDNTDGRRGNRSSSLSV
jgi:uncharacterized protein